MSSSEPGAGAVSHNAATQSPGIVHIKFDDRRMDVGLVKWRVLGRIGRVDGII